MNNTAYKNQLKYKRSVLLMTGCKGILLTSLKDKIDSIIKANCSLSLVQKKN